MTPRRRSARGAATHRCPAPDCPLDVPRSQFACREHWYALPKSLRDEITASFRVGALSKPHIEAMGRAQDWLAMTAATEPPG